MMKDQLWILLITVNEVILQKPGMEIEYVPEKVSILALEDKATSHQFNLNVTRDIKIFVGCQSASRNKLSLIH